MHWYRFISDERGITVTLSWWALIAYGAAIAGGVFLFRFVAVGGLPWIFSRIGLGRLGIYAVGIAMVPAGALMVVGALGIYHWERYKLQLGNQGIYWRHDRHLEQGAWDQLWAWNIYQSKSGQRDIHLEFFQGDVLDIFEGADLGEDFSRLVDFVAQRAQAVDLEEQRHRLLREDHRY